MCFLVPFYHYLVEEKRLEWLMRFAMYDERVYEVVNEHQLAPSILKSLPSPLSACFLARGLCYDSISKEVIANFDAVCTKLLYSKTVSEKAALSYLVGNCALLERDRVKIIQHRKAFEQLIQSDSLFAQRASLRLLAYIFSDDSLSDSVAQLHYHSDILDHISRVFVLTPDFVSRRFAVRCLALIGGFNESLADVQRTDAISSLVTHLIPEFTGYFLTAFLYATLRFYLRHKKCVTKRGLLSRCALFSATYCALIGVYCGSILEYRLHRLRFPCLRQQSEQDNGPPRGDCYHELENTNALSVSLHSVTHSLFKLQWTTYCITAGFLFISLFRLKQVTFPAWMGDVAWRFPLLPRLFPALVGLPSPSPRLVPFVFLPFTLVYVARPTKRGSSFYDYYIGKQ